MINEQLNAISDYLKGDVRNIVEIENMQRVGGKQGVYSVYSVSCSIQRRMGTIKKALRFFAYGWEEIPTEKRYFKIDENGGSLNPRQISEKEAKALVLI